MFRTVFQALVWLFLGPYLASSAWFFYLFVRNGSVLDLGIGRTFSMVPFAMLYGLFGVVYCLPIALPSFLVARIVLARYKIVMKQQKARRIFQVITSFIGLATASYMNMMLNTGSIEWALILDGTFLGFLLGFITLSVCGNEGEHS
jgi:hypothetical protein